MADEPEANGAMSADLPVAAKSEATSTKKADTPPVTAKVPKDEQKVNQFYSLYAICIC